MATAPPAFPAHPGYPQRAPSTLIPKSDSTFPKVNVFRPQCLGVCYSMCHPCLEWKPVSTPYLAEEPSALPGPRLLHLRDWWEVSVGCSLGSLTLSSVIPGEELGVMVPRRGGREDRTPFQVSSARRVRSTPMHSVASGNPGLYLIVKH